MMQRQTNVRPDTKYYSLDNVDTFLGRISFLLRHFDTLNNASEVCGVKAAQLSSYLTEKNKTLFDVICQLCDHTGVSMDWIAYGGWQPYREPRVETTDNLRISSSFDVDDQDSVSAEISRLEHVQAKLNQNLREARQAYRRLTGAEP